MSLEFLEICGLSIFLVNIIVFNLKNFIFFKLFLIDLLIEVFFWKFVFNEFLNVIS